MNFDFSDDQQAIKRTAKDFLAARFTAERVRALAEGGNYDDDAWKEICELGWPGIFVSEEHGGQGLGIVELVILMEELGYALAPLPFLSSAAAGLALQHAGSDEQRERWLPGIASGEVRATAGLAANGEARLVPDAEGGRPDRAPQPRRRQAGRGRTGGGRAGRDDRRHAPVRARAGGRRRCAAGRRGRGARPDRRRAGRRAHRGGAARHGDGGRVRPRPQAVRPPDRRLPGGIAPLRSDAARDGGRALGLLLRRLDRGRRAGVAARGCLDGEGLRLGRGLARRCLVAPGARRHRLHLGARPPLLPEARQGGRHPLRLRRRAPRPRGRAAPASRPSRTPA